MAIIKGTKKQARKRHRQSLVRRDKNRSVRNRVRRQMRKMRILSSEGDADKIGLALTETMSIIDAGLKRGVLHRNTAARYKSRMARQAKTGLTQAEA